MMKCPHCGSTVEYSSVLPFDPTLEARIFGIKRAWQPTKPFRLGPTPTSSHDPSPCEQFVKEVFDAVVKHYGEDEARRVFGPYGKQRTKREKNLETNAALYMNYLYERMQSNGKPNVRKLARRLAKETDTDPVAMERKIWRAIKSKKVHKYLLEH